MFDFRLISRKSYDLIIFTQNKEIVCIPNKPDPPVIPINSVFKPFIDNSLANIFFKFFLLTPSRNISSIYLNEIPFLILGSFKSFFE